jgi:hypothetical protein
LALYETFAKCSILLKVKPPAPLPARRAYRPEGRAYAPEGKTKILTTGIHDKYFED